MEVVTAMFLLSLGIVTTMLVTWCIVEDLTIERMRRRAASEGVGEYYLDENGFVQWRWKSRSLKDSETQ